MSVGDLGIFGESKMAKGGEVGVGDGENVSKTGWSMFEVEVGTGDSDPDGEGVVDVDGVGVLVDVGVGVVTGVGVGAGVGVGVGVEVGVGVGVGVDVGVGGGVGVGQAPQSIEQLEQVSPLEGWQTPFPQVAAAIKVVLYKNNKIKSRSDTNFLGINSSYHPLP